MKQYNVRLWLISKLSAIVRRFRYRLLVLKGYKNISSHAIIESNVMLDRVNPAGIHIGDNTLIASGTIILSHDHVRKKPNGEYWISDTSIGRNSFIGVRSLILPGVNIGDECCIGAGSVVTKDIPSNSIAVGCPAKVIKTGIKMNNNASIEND